MSVSKNYGGKLRRWNELSQSDQADLLYDLLNSFSLLKTPDEAAVFVTDLLTSDEVKFLSKRLRIAKLLLSDVGYTEISRALKVSPVTIAKVSAWLKESGAGIKRVISKLPERKKGKTGHDFPRYFWPGRLLEDFEKDAVKGKEKQLHGVLKKLSEKDVIRHREDEVYKESR